MNIIRRLSKHRRQPPPAAFLSQRPWAGFSAHDAAREEALARCPSPRCRRAKACLAAVDNLYCLRTHFSLDEQKRRNRQSPLQRELDRVPEVRDGNDLTARMERVVAIAEIRREHEKRLLEQWKAGVLDRLHGPYRSRGVMMTPPPKAYVESAGKRGGQAGPGDV